ncbi:MAG: universal stress protein [Blastocatellia bacterium]
MKLLIAYDGSDCSDRTLVELRLAGLPDDVEAVVATVAERWLPPPSASALSTPSDNAKSGLEKASDIASRACARLAKQFPKWDIRAAVSKGSPASQILDDVEAWDPDLVVVGSHGHSALANVLLGSVSAKVAAAAPCSVRISRGRVEDIVGPVRLLIGLDSSMESQRAVRSVMQRPWPPGSTAMILTAVDPELEGSAVQDTELGWIDMLQRTAESELRSDGLTVERHVAEGDPRRLLPRAAADWKADCIFVGSHGHGRLKRLFIGSVANAVAARAACSVEIVRG